MSVYGPVLGYAVAMMVLAVIIMARDGVVWKWLLAVAAGMGALFGVLYVWGDWADAVFGMILGMVFVAIVTGVGAFVRFKPGYRTER